MTGDDLTAHLEDEQRTNHSQSALALVNSWQGQAGSTKIMKKRKKHAKQGELQNITKAVTHIRLEAANPGKLAALDQLAGVGG